MKGQQAEGEGPEGFGSLLEAAQTSAADSLQGGGHCLLLSGNDFPTLSLALDEPHLSLLLGNQHVEGGETPLLILSHLQWPAAAWES